ncbi:MAG: PAS domain S-box protein [Archangium sp.]|nr:PAS domain S-box protein [Archangium sp.]
MDQLPDFFQEAFRVAPVGMLVVDGRGVIVDVNRQLERLFGYSREQLLGQPVELLVDGLAESHRSQREAYLARPAPRPMGAGRDLFGRHRDGHRVPVEIGLTPLAAAGTTWVLASVVDLTERKRADEQFRLAIEAAPNGMMLVNEEGTIVLVNQQIEQLFGYTRDELIGRSVDELLPARFRHGHDGSRRSFFAQPRARPMGAGRELFGLRKDGREVPVEIGLSPLQTARGVLVLSSIVDITERRHARELLQASLTETETLLKELHHRAKNNLQLIASLLDLASAAPGPDVLRECRDRINSIALVHEKLYQSGTFAKIELSDYLRTLSEQVTFAWTRPEGAPIDVRIEAEDIFLPLDRAIPCGLVINELLTNAFKHAFPGARGGTVWVRAVREGARLHLSVEDDGVGMAQGVGRAGHIGLELVHALARQLRGELHFGGGRGTHVSLRFEGSAHDDGTS